MNGISIHIVPMHTSRRDLAATPRRSSAWYSSAVTAVSRASVPRLRGSLMDLTIGMLFAKA